MLSDYYWKLAIFVRGIFSMPVNIYTKKDHQMSKNRLSFFIRHFRENIDKFPNILLMDKMSFNIYSGSV
jgi:hypothetical protein